MDNYFIGGIGITFGWQLVSTRPFVIFDERTREFTGFATLVECIALLDSAEHTVYAFSNLTATWQKIDFAAEATGPRKPAIGFRPN
jgi:hypothetical protein